METLKKNKKAVVLITYAVVLVFVLFNIDRVNSMIGSLFTMMLPVVYGLIFAFLVGLIARGVKMMCYKMNMTKKSAEIMSIILGYIIFLAIIAGFFVLVIPALNRSISDIVGNLPYFWSEIYSFAREIARDLEISSDQWAIINEYLDNAYTNIYGFVTDKLPDIIGYAFDMVTFVKNLGFGFVISVYILISRKSLSKQVKKTITVFFPDEISKKIIQTGKNANRVFRKYISGQVIVSVALGIACYVCMIIFKMPDAVLVSLIIGMSNLVPIVGPIVGSIPTTLIVMMKSPIQGLWFLLLVIVLQQVESNIITPKIIGDSVGLGGLWVMIAIIIGGGLFGVGGMIISVPTMAVIYHLFAEYVNDKYDRKFDDIVNENK